MKTIPLSQGKVALVDDADYERLCARDWCAEKQRRKFYAKRGEAGSTVYMHREILDAPAGLEVDHVDGNGLNNTRANLRLATTSQNLANREKTKANTSGFKGVYWDASRGAWRAQIKVNGRKYNLGRFDALEDAARAYDAAARELHGEFALTNSQENQS